MTYEQAIEKVRSGCMEDLWDLDQSELLLLAEVLKDERERAGEGFHNELQRFVSKRKEELTNEFPANQEPGKRRGGPKGGRGRRGGGDNSMTFWSRKCNFRH